jgi:signal transduction histidine kinase
MRRRLAITSLAVTSMVVASFLIPLGLLVRDLAHDRALSAAEREAESVARFIAVVGPERGIEQAVAAGGETDGDELETSVVSADGIVTGAPLRQGEDGSAASGGVSVRAVVDGGEAVYVPILQSDGSLLTVRVFAPDALLRRGVTASWVTLGLLGVLLVVIAAAVFDRLARTIVAPVEELSSTAAALGDGNLDARVVPAGPKEVHDVGAQFNRLADRIGQLLQQERETAADLSHQLRTPLTAVRLDVEALPNGPERTRLVEDVDELERHVDFVIREARREVRRPPGVTSEIVRVVANRLAFWQPLAEEQGRAVTWDEPETHATVALPEVDLVAMIDALIGNVFAHTPEGAAFSVSLTVSDEVVLRIEDAGPGFPDESVIDRGAGAGTGLGLDIVRRTAESAGGAMTIGAAPRLSGALVTVVLPPA